MTRRYLKLRLCSLPALLLTMMIIQSPLSYAEITDDWQVTGEHGSVHVTGAMTEAACGLDMASAWQMVSLGSTATGELLKTGAHGTPVTFQLKLLNCLRRGGVGGRETDSRTGAVSWSAIQPVVSVTFVAPADPASPQLVSLKGVQGAGLRIRDSAQRDVRLGHRGVPLFLEPDSDILTYSAAVERTPGELAPGAWRAVVGFQLSYD